MNTVKLHEELKAIAEQKRLSGKCRHVTNAKRAWSAYEVSTKWQAYLFRERKKLRAELDVISRQRASIVNRIDTEKNSLKNELQFDIIQRTIPLRELEVPLRREYKMVPENSENSKTGQENGVSKLPVFKSVPAWLLSDKTRAATNKRSKIQMRVYDFKRQGTFAVYRTTTFDMENID